VFEAFLLEMEQFPFSWGYGPAVQKPTGWMQWCNQGAENGQLPIAFGDLPIEIFFFRIVYLVLK